MAGEQASSSSGLQQACMVLILCEKSQNRGQAGRADSEKRGVLVRIPWDEEDNAGSKRCT